MVDFGSHKNPRTPAASGRGSTTSSASTPQGGVAGGRDRRRPRRPPRAGREGNGEVHHRPGLADLLPDQRVVADCDFGCHPEDASLQCVDCRDRENPPTAMRPVPLVTLPLGATRERIVGTLSVADALDGDHEFDPGLLARAHRGVLYVDEVNLLDDHLVDVLLSAAASGVNHVERDGISVTHPAEFTLVGTMNPEEGDLRPQPATGSRSRRQSRVVRTSTTASRSSTRRWTRPPKPRIRRPPDATPASACAMPGTASATSYSNAPPRGHRGTLPGRPASTVIAATSRQRGPHERSPLSTAATASRRTTSRPRHASRSCIDSGHNRSRTPRRRGGRRRTLRRRRWRRGRHESDAEDGAR